MHSHIERSHHYIRTTTLERGKVNERARGVREREREKKKNAGYKHMRVEHRHLCMYISVVAAAAR